MVTIGNGKKTIMKICSKCFREFDEREDTNYHPPVELGNIFMEDTVDADSADLCLECREELGMLNIAGFRM
jgi:hypothetical protein